jgi:hypothetical protein
MNSHWQRDKLNLRYTEKLTCYFTHNKKRVFSKRATFYLAHDKLDSYIYIVYDFFIYIYIFRYVNKLRSILITIKKHD